jgi:hypothetical protein
MFKTFVDVLRIMPVALSPRVETANTTTVLLVCVFLDKPCFAMASWTVSVDSFGIIKFLGIAYILQGQSPFHSRLTDEMVADYAKNHPHLGEEPVDIEDLVKIGKTEGP